MPHSLCTFETVEERRELFRKEVETEQCRRHKIQIELQKLQATPSLRSQIANKLSVTKKENLTISRLSTDSVAWRNMLEANPEYKGLFMAPMYRVLSVK